MENATDALIMAGSVLLLIIALTVSISSLTNVKHQFQDILDTRDQIDLAKANGDYINYLTSDGNATRAVEIETIISTIRRMRKENYTIYINAKPGTLNIIEGDCELKGIDTKEMLIKTAYVTRDPESGATSIPQNHDIMKLDMDNTNSIFLNPDKYYIFTGIMYNNLKDKTFLEYTGTYEEKTSPDVTSANKGDVKIITFKEI